ncbi:uncharacterized protein LOC110990146 [Acanthaster planci]|uniref:Uncharacterized protein LOC110990146 n=1 Tax=Acanthaster planci TaxID=133434 RepID=A0A8B8A003_ACAPL|nr:uncharacterized protein LOC110990146 [Acanthaster planci]
MTRTRSQSHLVLVLRALLLVAFFSNSLDAAKLEQNGSCMFSCPSRDAEVVSNTQTGLPAYRILNKIDGHIYIGSNETLTRLSIKNNQVTTNQITLQTMEPTLVVNCAAQNPSNKETVCWNFIRVAERTSSGQLLVCGTNAFSRLCYVCSTSGPITCNAISSSTSALLFVPQQIDVTASVSVINDGTSDMLYGGSRRDQDTTFNRYALNSDLNAHNPIEFQLDTVVVGMGFINDGTFVGRPFEYTHDDGREYAFFFYRENALEYTSGEKVYSRIARVCKNDIGGITNTNRFITFIKARLQCSISDSNIPFYYDDIQDVVWDANKKVAYGVFTSPKAGPSTSALCSYRIEDIMNLFDNGYFSKQPGGDVNRQWQEITEASGDDFPLPRPGLCKENRTTDYSPLLFRLVPNYNPDDHTSGSDATRTPPDLPYSDPPILFVDGVRFTSLVVDHDNDCTYFFGATTGTVVRAQKENCSNPDEKFSFVEVRDKGTSGPITGLEFLSKDSIKYLVITTEDRVITMPLNPDCSGETDEDRQVAQYPCCEFSDSACTCCQNGHLVESLYIDCSVTYATTVINICVESDRLNSTITQTDITAFNNDMNSFTCAEHVFCLDSGDGSNSVTCLVTDQHRILLIRKLLFRVRAKPVLTVPSVPNLSAKFKSGRFAVGVSWAEITATDTKDLPFVNDINCTDRGYATSVGVRGGMFGLGPHEVTCSATNSDGCQASKTFTFYVKASPVFIRANESAQIASPNYLRTASSHKQSNVNLTWIIRTENGRRIRIIFHNLDNHNGSVFRAGDGNDSADSATMFFEWKGTGEVPHLISLGDTVWLTFDGAYNNAAGFFLSAFSLPSSGANGDKCAASGVPPSCGMCVGPINNDMTRGPPCSCQAGKMGALCDIECPDLSLSIPDGVEFDANKEPVFVTWDEVTGNQTEIATGIGCASPGYGPGDVTVTGGLFKEGSHTVTCSAFDSNGCEVLERFTFSVNLHDLASTLVPDICQSTDKDINGLLGCSSKIVVTHENANVIAETVARLARK